MSNLLEYENRYYDLGYDYIIGLDEAGRGPMAGELVVAGGIFPKGFYDERIFDSKQLTAKKREAMYQIIIENALAYHIEVISVEDVDQLNVYSASQKGMEKCCQILKREKMFALTDAMPLHDIEHLSIIKGDTLSMSIAAASILAKVTRDHLMIMQKNIHNMVLKNIRAMSPRHIKRHLENMVHALFIGNLLNQYKK